MQYQGFRCEWCRETYEWEPGVRPAEIHVTYFFNEKEEICANCNRAFESAIRQAGEAVREARKALRSAA